MTSYLRDAAHADANAAACVEALGGRAVPTTVIVAVSLVSDGLVEIEAIAPADAARSSHRPAAR